MANDSPYGLAVLPTEIGDTRLGASSRENTSTSGYVRLSTLFDAQ